METQPNKPSEEEKPPRPKRVVVYPKDVMTFMGISERASRELLGRIRKALGRKPRDPLNYKDVVKYLKWEDESLVTDVLKASIHIPLLLAIYLMIFQDDMELGFRCLLAWVGLIVFRKDIMRTIAYGRKRFFKKKQKKISEESAEVNPSEIPDLKDQEDS
jgi:hypothetical protein